MMQDIRCKIKLLENKQARLSWLDYIEYVNFTFNIFRECILAQTDEKIYLLDKLSNK